MKSLFIKISIFLLAMFFGTSSFATHIMGGEITWECLNNGQYVFTLKVYRDCNGINYNTNNLALEVHDYPSAGNITLIPVSFFSVEDITPSCEGSPCATLQRSDPDIAGAIEEYILRSAPVTLNGVPPANGWAFTWTSGNRNAAIDNINNAQNFGITLRAIMFPYFGQNANLCFDSSPDFYQKPSTIICAGEKFTYNHSAFDVDLDSLAYDWAKPLEGNLCGTSPCQIGGVFAQGANPLEIPFDAADGYSFNSPYPGTMQDPLNVPAVLDPETGEITFTSNTNGEFVSVIKVTAYKCGQKVAEIYRELQTVIASGCASNEPPVISALANNSYRDTVKVGDTVRFRINILDSIRADNPNVDSIFVFASGQQFGANFTNPNAGCLNPPCAILSSPLPDTGIGRYTTDFYWEVTCDHIQNTTPICYATANSYQFIVRAFDNFCPAAGQTIATYTITILADSLVDNPDINCANVDGSGDVTIDWDGIYDPDKTFSAYLIYVADFRNGPYTLLDSIFDSTLTSYTHIGAGANANSKHYIVRVRSGCQAGWTILPADTISTLYINPILNDTCISLNWTGLTRPLSSNSDTNYLIYREYPEGSGFILYDSTNLLSYCDTFTVCTDTVTYRIELGNNSGDCPASTSNTQGLRFKYPDPIANFTFTTPCSDLTIPFTNTTTVVPDSIATFNWSFGDGGSSSLKNPSHTYASPGSYTVKLITTSTKGCIDSISQVVTPDVPFVEAGPNGTICLRDSIQIGGSPTSSTANVTYSWSPINGVSNPLVANPNVSPLDTTVYKVIVTNANGCTNIDSVTVFVKKLPTADAGINPTICIGDTVTIGGSPTSSTTGVTYSWQPSSGLSSTTDPNPRAFATSSQTYTLTALAPNGCSDTSTVRVNVNNLPIVDAGANKNICIGQTVEIGGTPTGPLNSTYSWTPTTTISSTTVANPDVFPTVNTTYIVEVTDSNGCISRDSVAIILQPSPAADAGSDQTVCKEDFPTLLNGSVSVSNDGRWVGGNGVFNPDRNTLNATYAATQTEINAGFVELQLISSNIGICTPDTDVVRITIPAFIGAITLGSTNVSCNAQADGKAFINTTGINSPYTYRWNTNTGVQIGDTARGLTAGTYSLTITNTIGCDSITTITITEPADLTSSIGTSTNVSCNGGADGTATVSPAGGTTPYTYVWPSGTLTANETGLSQGTYVVTVTDANGCTSTSSVTITEPTILSSTISSTVNVSCNGGSNGTATVMPSGGTTPYTYAWPSGTLTANETGLSQGTYVVTVTDVNGCTTTSSVTLTEPTVLTSSIGTSTNVSCNGGSDGTASVTPSGGTTPYSYAWPSGTLTAAETGLSQGTYVVTVTDAKGCTSTSSVTITEPTVLSSTISSTVNVSCNGGSDGTATVTPSGGTTPYTYAWPSGTLTANETGLSQGTYVVTVTDGNSCTSTSSITITEPAVLTSSIGTSTNVSCNGGSDGTATVSPAGGTTPYIYAWPSGTLTANETGLSQGTYVVTVTDVNGCTSTSSVTITEPTVLSSSISSSVNVSCNGGSDGTATVTPAGGTTPYTYAWPSGTLTANETGLSQGTYVVTVTDANGCTTTSSVTLTEPTVLASSIGTSTNVSCNGGSDGTAAVTPTGGSTPYSYAWPSGTLTANETGLSQGTYVVTVTDAKGCTSTSSVVVTQPDTLKITTGNIPVSCFGQSDGQLIATPVGGTSPYSFNWSNSFTDSVNLGLAIGSYQVTITDANGCSTNTSLTITQPDVIRLTVSPRDTICIGNSSTIQATATGGNTNYTYNWNNNLSNSRTHVVSPNEKTTYTVSVNDEKGCSTTQDSIVINVRDLSKTNLQAFSAGNICAGETTTISATHDGSLGGYGYTWSNNVGNGLGPITVSPTITTQYIVNAFDVCGTILSDSIDVLVESYPLLNLPSTIKEGCEPLTVNFVDSLNSNANNLIYSWDLGDGTFSSSSNFDHTYDTEGSYPVTLKITTPGGCESNSSGLSQVIVYPTPQANFTLNPRLTDLNNPVVTFQNTSLKEDNIKWDFYDSFTSIRNDTVIQFADTGWFSIKLVAYTAFGCKDSIVKNLRVNPVYEIVVPNAFTPNTGGPSSGFYGKNDLSNDIFYVHADLVRNYEMQIFNRWGELIFQTKDVNQGWDGYYLGKLSPQDVYVYKVTVEFLNGKTETKTGNFTLFR